MSKSYLNVLLVEDDEDDYFLLAEEFAGVELWEPVIDWATTYEEARKKIETSTYDVYLFDYNLGSHDGIELLKSIARHRLYGPVIMITGLHDKKLDYRAMDAGVDDFLVKGRFDADMLERSIRHAIERKKMDRQKDEFISIVSHELRTPLTAIKGSIGLILLGKTGEITEETRKMAVISDRNCNRLLGIVNDLLDVQKIAAGKLEIDRAPVCLVDILKQAVESHLGYAREKNIQYLLDIQTTEDLKVTGDEARLLQVLANLLSNATKFSPEGGQVRINLTQNNELAARVSITDEGPGIPEEFRSTIFGKFSQADSSTARNHSGTGLGLNIARSIIELHGGTISFHPEMVRGTTFYFDLPLEPVSQFS